MTNMCWVLFNRSLNNGNSNLKTFSIERESDLQISNTKNTKPMRLLAWNWRFQTENINDTSQEIPLKAIIHPIVMGVHVCRCASTRKFCRAATSKNGPWCFTAPGTRRTPICPCPTRTPSWPWSRRPTRSARKSKPITTNTQQPAAQTQQRFDCKFRATVPIFFSTFFLCLDLDFSSLTASVVQDSGRRSPRRGGGHLSFALPPLSDLGKRRSPRPDDDNGGWNFQPILFALLVFLDIQIKRNAFPKWPSPP